MVEAIKEIGLLNARITSRAVLARRGLWLRQWTVDTDSSKGVEGLTFTGEASVGDKIDKWISKATAGLPQGYRNQMPKMNKIRRNETWRMCNCTMARCLENNTVEIIKLQCEDPPMITCANRRPPINVTDDDNCCWHWECDCVCTGWGDPHYVTFDGTYYSYQGNCTYTLVEEIIKKVDNFGVYIENYDCGALDRVSCPCNIIVRHHSQNISIATTSLTSRNLQVLVNGEIVGIPFKKYGVNVYKSGINYVVEITELKAIITYSGFNFYIKLPYKHFKNNTQGQCGTCTNNKTDDCMTRSGEIVSNCELMADAWIVPDTGKPGCDHLRPTLPPKVAKPSTPCTPSPLCNLINGPIFDACHKTIPPKDFYEACTYDSCHVSNSNLTCTSLENYAFLCGDQGICIDWRKAAPECPKSCPSHQVYDACGPALLRTCQTTPEEDVLLTKEKRLVEGCFCPPGTKTFSPIKDVCVDTCGKKSTPGHSNVSGSSKRAASSSKSTNLSAVLSAEEGEHNVLSDTESGVSYEDSPLQIDVPALVVAIKKILQITDDEDSNTVAKKTDMFKWQKVAKKLNTLF
ncbi:intestinal mucin-like protein [Pseudophryne corroboree]|uniref:intestinal mucin-like protein n=1 Tax=Pseudophryne corroboree TaxID=495146 RepID=UPI0030814FC4